MDNHINTLKSDIKYKIYIQKLKHELSPGLEVSHSGNYIEHFTFAKAATGRLDDISKQLGKIDIVDLTKTGTKTSNIGYLAKKFDYSDLTKAGTKSTSGAADLAKKFDFGDLTKAGTKTSDIGYLAKKFDYADLTKAGTKSTSGAADLAKKFDFGDLTSLGKNIDDISKTTAKSMKKGLDDITKGTKNVGTKASKKLDDVGDQVKDFYKQSKNFDWDSAKTFAKDNKFLLIGGVAVGIIASVALAKFEEVNNKSFNITTISTDKDTGYIKLQYSPSQTFHEDDIIEIIESNSTPKLLGTHNIYDLIDDSSLLIKNTDIKLETDGTKGIFIYKTTLGNMFQTVIRDTVSNTADIASKGILQPALVGSLDVAKDTGKTIFTTLIPLKYRTAFYWGGIGTLILIFLISLFALYKNLT
jgi:hypothetical protein